MTNEYCIRCTHEFKGEIKFLFFGQYYCQSCVIAIENDRSWPITLYMADTLKDIEQIEA